MKKIILLFILSAISLIATLAFVNNIFAIVDWWRSFIAAGGNSAAMEPHHGCISWLDWSAVDYSAVTTFIPMVGLWCMTAGLFKITRRKRVKVENFPFYKGSDQLNVALGLFGTLWGIIVIGYFDLSTVSMADLMQCLHTALFSTLTAVVWVFMIDRPLVRPLFARMLAADDLADTDEDDLASAVERLVVRLGAASDEFDKRIKAYEEASESRQRAYEERFQKSFKSYEVALENRHKAYGESFDKILRDCEESCLRRQNTYETAFDNRLKTFEETFAARQKAYAESFESALKAGEETFEKRQKAYFDAFEKRLAEYEKEFDARQKEYVEIFRRRIDELEKSFLEEKARADASNAKLIAVTNALK